MCMLLIRNGDGRTTHGVNTANKPDAEYGQETPGGGTGLPFAPTHEYASGFSLEGDMLNSRRIIYPPIYNSADRKAKEILHQSIVCNC
ncbi:hypothetical protein C5167_014549 [Papaver somniferum]|uniref:Uncharacterized protein n=1 Tax=Papaver somniferum TaxID=3469 RepID=A0A4Y7J6L4_PAPSO|nr:hypothetical protein C5167_014549 [Papaver somniferum]